MNIMYAADDNYAWLAGISLLSFLENNNNTTHSIYILDNNISKDNKDKINSIVSKYKSNIFYIDVYDKLLQLKKHGFNESGTQYNMTVYARLFAIDFLPNTIEKILYVDCDSLIIKDISELENIKMYKALQMRPDCIHNAYKKFINMSKENKYYNSGIMLINVPVWKKHKCTEALIEFKKNYNKECVFPDQDIVNKAIYEDIEDLKVFGYNCQSQMFLFDYKECLKVYDLNKDNYLTKEDYNKTVQNPKILHFCGQSFIRPWYCNSNHPYAKKWNTYFNMSPWNDRKLDKYNASFTDKVRFFLHKYCPSNIEVLISKIANRCYILYLYKV